MTNNTTFEDYLMETYIREENPLDDMVADGFSDWLSDQDVNDIVEYGDKFIKQLKKYYDTRTNHNTKLSKRRAW